ncbi:MAG: cysteine synthase family protein, partial [Bdellovibrionales bacterium]|nr:cysteine synthase family protein [Bdellovibrionales bacterium]
MSGKFDNLLQLVGRTPLVKLQRVVPESSATVWVKLEYLNPGGSVKDRMAVAMIEDAEREGTLKPGDTLVEASSGNAGIGLAFAAAVKGYPLVIVTPSVMSKEKMRIIRALGAELIVVEATEWIGMHIAGEKAQELVETCGYVMLNQMENPANPEIHETTTGPEIVEAFQGTEVHGFVAGVGTG